MYVTMSENYSKS